MPPCLAVVRSFPWVPMSDKPHSNADREPQPPRAGSRELAVGRMRAIGAHMARRRHDAVASAGYSRFVGLMKFVLPAGAALLVALVVAWPYLSGRDAGLPFSFANVENVAAEALFMTNSRYFGTDDKNQQFSITAESVIQETADPDTLRFRLPKADILLDDGSWLAVTADEGMLNRSRQVLVLDGSVSFFSDKGFEISTERAQVDLARSVASSRSPVSGQGPFGLLRAEGFSYNKEDGTLRFDGRVHMTLNPRTGI